MKYRFLEVGEKIEEGDLNMWCCPDCGWRPVRHYHIGCKVKFEWEAEMYKREIKSDVIIL